MANNTFSGGGDISDGGQWSLGHVPTDGTETVDIDSAPDSGTGVAIICDTLALSADISAATGTITTAGGITVSSGGTDGGNWSYVGNVSITSTSAYQVGNITGDLTIVNNSGGNASSVGTVSGNVHVEEATGTGVGIVSVGGNLDVDENQNLDSWSFGAIGGNVTALLLLNGQGWTVGSVTGNVTVSIVSGSGSYAFIGVGGNIGGNVTLTGDKTVVDGGMMIVQMVGFTIHGNLILQGRSLVNCLVVDGYVEQHFFCGNVAGLICYAGDVNSGNDAAAGPTTVTGGRRFIRDSNASVFSTAITGWNATSINLGVANASITGLDAAFLVTGHNILSLTASYPTTATSQAAQLATDQAAVSTKKAYIYPNANLLGVNDGTLRASNIGTLAGTSNLTVAMVPLGTTIDNVVGTSGDDTASYDAGYTAGLAAGSGGGLLLFL